MLYSMHDTPLFLQPQKVAHREQTPSHYMLDAQLVLWTQNITHSKPQFNSLTHTYQEYYSDNTVEPRSIVFQGTGENKR